MNNCLHFLTRDMLNEARNLLNYQEGFRVFKSS